LSIIFPSFLFEQQGYVYLCKGKEEEVMEKEVEEG